MKQEQPRAQTGKHEKEEGSTQELSHLASLAGLGLIGHVADLAEAGCEEIVAERPSGSALAIDPRAAVEPRKRYSPR
ncbi:hypothetical protein [Cupriavidus taiwanensis]|uniref:Uncharacterized protein n=1 Tax=Cupriavidus taiwanensis TaxID=164546 RepID=A0A7Z7NQ79_9BURK|nr:hypothetical protein [Cupriavidus taiwanensis]SOZ17295.1 conserved hypothetical protein [Cupriavidus taiwanensis]SOZ96386.1 conserved hypothetical protein [Cupriavidus taiwanensis]SPC25667.1 conserved hypothetical protein [Cupriavidus taiwanensis]